MLRPCFTFAVGIVALCHLSSSQAGDAVPVLLWGALSNFNSELENGVNPLLKTTRAELVDILENRICDSQRPFVAYVKDSLCVEDFTLHKDDLQRLTSGGSLMYIPAAVSPVSAFESLPCYNQTYESDDDSISSGQMLIKSITDIENIDDSYKMLKESNPDMLAALTGNFCSYSRSERVKRQAPENSTFTVITEEDRKIILYSSERPYLKVKDSDAVQLPFPSTTMAINPTAKEPISLQLTFSMPNVSNGKLVLDFHLETRTPGYYTLETVHYKENTNDIPLITNSEIIFPYNFSYHCSQNIVFSNGSVSLYFTNLQIQVDATRFDDAYDCVGFTTIPIWTGIFVTAILALIMIWALTMIMDIRTMDRFDDPKGKTITISAQE